MWFKLWVWIELNAVDQGSPNFFVQGSHNLSHNSSGLDILRNVTVLGYVTFYQINKLCKYIIFSLVRKCLLKPDEIVTWAGFGPWVVVWRPCYRCFDISSSFCVVGNEIKMRIFKHATNNILPEMIWLCQIYLDLFAGIFRHQVRKSVCEM